MRTDVTAVSGGNATLHPVVSEHHSLELFSSNAGPALATLAAEINAEHEAADGHARKAIEHARAAGDKLLLAKAGVAHGQWLPWMAANCPKVSIRRAQEYMRVAREWPALQAKYAESAHLTIDGALALLAAPTPEPLPPVSAAPPAPATAPPPAPAAPAPAAPPANPPQKVSLVEKINREHQLSRSKADEAKRHELALGKMLLQVKASMDADQWTAWLDEQRQAGAVELSEYDASRALHAAEHAAREAAERVERLKSLWLFPGRESFLTLVDAEQAREIRRHWLVEEAAWAQRYVARQLEELRGQPDMQRWLQTDSLMLALEKAEIAERRAKGVTEELSTSDKRVLFERAKSMLGWEARP